MQDLFERRRMARYLAEHRRARYCSMDGPFYNDLLPPFITSSIATVTLASTLRGLYGVGNIKAMGKDYWRVGKKVAIHLFGAITTGATPGNLTLSVLYGTGADANGVTLASSAALTLIASQTTLTWEILLRIRCVTEGSAGTLFCTGEGLINSAVVASHHFLVPASAPAVSGACDLTVASNILSVQASRSGSTAETMQVHDLEAFALN